MFQKPYQTQNVPLINYNFTDTITGVSYKTFYAGDASGTKFLISSPTASSWGGITQVGNSIYQGSLVLAGTYNFDTTFNIPQIIEGDAVAQFTLGQYWEGNATGTRRQARISLQKNTVELISGATTATVAADGSAGDTLSAPEAIILPVPKTSFAIGDTLRMEVKIYGQGQGSPGQDIKPGIGTDPNGAKDEGTKKVIEDTDSTIFKLHLPFRADI
ncbi:MAG: hypothetical protein ACTSQE_14695 [Candidatus Heimdallarchaeaceae archaeon]